jgi:hypothetical protein
MVNQSAPKVMIPLNAGAKPGMLSIIDEQKENKKNGWWDCYEKRIRCGTHYICRNISSMGPLSNQRRSAKLAALRAVQ